MIQTWSVFLRPAVQALLRPPTAPKDQAEDGKDSTRTFPEMPAYRRWVRGLIWNIIK